MNTGPGMWGTPDYFHPCGPAIVSPPVTFAGTCVPQDGVAMMSLILYNVPYPNYREYIATPLNCTMQPGTTYTLSFWLTNGTGILSPWTISNFGVHFSNGPLTQAGFGLINVVPQCEVTANITTTVWTQYTFTVNPTAQWNYMTLGAFRADASNSPVMSYPNPGGNPSVYANYYIDNVQVLSPSVSGFSLNTILDQSVCATPNSATVVSSNNSHPIQYSWLPPVSNGSVASNLAPGPYSVIATATAGCSSFSAGTSFTVSSYSGPSVTVNSPTVCKGQSAVLSATVSGGVAGYSYLWQPGSSTTPTVGVNNSSTVFTLSVSDATGCVATTTAALKESIVTAKFTFTVPECSSQLRITNESTAASYNWKFGDGNQSSALHPVHQYLQNGTYRLRLLAVNALGCVDSSSAMINIVPVVKAGMTASITNCDSILQVQNLSEDATSVVWHFGDGNSSALFDPVTHEYQEGGLYKVMLVATGADGCRDTVIRQIQVIIKSVAAFSLNYQPCEKIVSFVNTSSFVASSSWQIGSMSSTETNPVITFTSGGYYNVNLVVNAGLTCSASVSRSLQIFEKVPSAFDYSVNTCNGQVSFFNRSLISDNPLWSFGDGNFSREQNPVHFFGAPGLYEAQLTSPADRTCAVPEKMLINVTYTPVIAEFSLTTGDYGEGTVLHNFSQNASKYLWEYGDGKTSESFEPSVLNVIDRPTRICLMASDTAGCSDTLCRKIAVDVTWTFYLPNTFTPNQDALNDVLLAKATNITDFKFEVFDRWGELIFTSDNLYHGWNGFHRGKESPVGTYVWKASFFDLQKKVHHKVGIVELLR